MKLAWLIFVVMMGALIWSLAWWTEGAVRASVGRLDASVAARAEAPPAVPVASLAEVGFCTEAFKGVLQRVLTSCGLLGGGRRGCQPGDVRNVAKISDEDFNALFANLGERAGIILFDKASEELDEAARALVEELWLDRRGASYFFIVARASADGAVELNRALSHKRANSAYFHVADHLKDEAVDVEKTVDLMWLGEEYAQLGTEFCRWQSSRPDDECTAETINRSAILSWIDCRL